MRKNAACLSVYLFVCYLSSRNPLNLVNLRFILRQEILERHGKLRYSRGIMMKTFLADEVV